jgi:hypothetical protein
VYSKTDVELVLTSSLDGTVKLWDLRKPDSAALVFRDTSDPAKHKVCSGPEKTEV